MHAVRARECCGQKGVWDVDTNVGQRETREKGDRKKERRARRREEKKRGEGKRKSMRVSEEGEDSEAER